MGTLHLRTALRITSHRKALLISFPDSESSLCRFQHRHFSCLCNKLVERPALFHTYFRMATSNLQHTYIPSRNTLIKRLTGHRQALEGNHVLYPRHSMPSNKFLFQVYQSNWAKDRLVNIFHKIGLYDVKFKLPTDDIKPKLPTHLTDKINRLSDWMDKEEKKIIEEIKQETKESLPVPEDLSDKETTSVKRFKELIKKGDDCEHDTLEKAIEDTNLSIASYYKEQAQHKEFPSKHEVPPQIHTHTEQTPRRDLSAKYTAAPNISAKDTAAPNIPAKEEKVVGWNLFNWIPSAFSAFLDASVSSKKEPLIKKKTIVSRTAIEAKTRELVFNLKSAPSQPAKLKQLEKLCNHMRDYQGSLHEATELGAVSMLLRLAATSDEEIRGEAVEGLALLGYAPPVKGRGVRILALDGGGTRGLVSIQCLKQLEKLSNRKVYELFDYVSGVSTGALIATMVFLFRMPLDECEQLYMEFGGKMFSRSRVKGTGGLVWNYSFYDSEQWEQILRAEIGHKTMIEFARDPLVPKVSAVSTLMNTPNVKKFVFRNYNFSPSIYSYYPGSCTNKLWEVVRASSAAPGYYEDFPLGDFVHSDGGLSTNNPTALAVHESRLLWPHEQIQCVLSLGTGRYEPTQEIIQSSKVSLREKINKVIDSVTDTEAVHIMMTDLMPPSTYFRFNPYLSENLQLDEIRQDRLENMKRDTDLYLRKNQLKMEKAANTLKHERFFYQHVMDWVKLKSDTYI